MITPYKHERKLFITASIISILLWLLLIGITFGIALLCLLLIFLVYLFVHSGFISTLKGNGVKISAEQFPDLHRQLTACGSPSTSMLIWGRSPPPASSGCLTTN